MLLPFKNWLLNVLVSLVEFERVILLGSTYAGQEIIYPVGGSVPSVGGFTITLSVTVALIVPPEFKTKLQL